MCVIIHLEKDATIDERMVVNATYNNPHGYGFISIEPDGSLNVQRVVPESKETDPNVILKLLEDNKDKERILHLRWATVGEVTLDNAHPFKVYEHEEDEEEAWFMHNGTLYGYGSESKYWAGCYNYAAEEWIEAEEDMSDTREFAMTVLEPYLSRWDGDYSDYHFKVMLDKFWSGTSMGILVSNYMPVWRFGGKWHELDSNCSTGKVFASNDSYFDRVTRGPEYDRRQEAVRKEREKNNTGVVAWNSGNSRDKGTLDLVDIKDTGAAPLHFRALQELFTDLPFLVETEKVLSVCRSLTNDELAALVIAEYDHMKEGTWDYDKSPVCQILMAYSFYFETLLEAAEEKTGKNGVEIITERARSLSATD